MSGHFILPGRIDLPFIYQVRRLRSGGMYSVRLVEVYQDETQSASPPPPSSSENPVPSISSRTPCFIATISFKRPELYPQTLSSSPSQPVPDLPPSPTPPLKYVPFSHQTLSSSYLRTTYPMLFGRPPASHPLAQASDCEWWPTFTAHEHPHPDGTFPGVEMRKVDLDGSNFNPKAVAQGGVGQYRFLHMYRMIEPDESPLESSSSSSNAGAEEEDEDNNEWRRLNLSLAAHLYASDRNGLFLIARALGFGNGLFDITSLSHSVVFHAAPEQLLMQAPQRSLGNIQHTWFVQEAWSSVSGGNRAMHESRLFSWNEQSGEAEVLASTFQEGLCRLTSKTSPVGDGGQAEDGGTAKEQGGGRTAKM